MESRQLEDSKDLTDGHLQKEQNSIKSQLSKFESLQADFGDMALESRDAAAIYRARMQEMSAVRERKLAANCKLLMSMESTII